MSIHGVIGSIRVWTGGRDVTATLQAHGIRVEEIGEQVIVHLDALGGEIPGGVLVVEYLSEALHKPLLPTLAKLVHPHQAYLRHDPTKRHRRTRSKR